MNESSCASVHERLRRGDPLGPAQEAHTRDCPACAALAEDDGVLGRALGGMPAAAPVSSDAAFAALEARIAGDRGLRGRLAGQPTWLRFLLAVLVLAGVAGVNGVLLRPDFALYPAVRMALTLALLGLGGVAYAWLALRPLHAPPLRTRLVLVLGAACVLVPIVFALLPVAHLDHAACFEGGGGRFWGKSLACLVWGSVFAAPLVLLLLLSQRGPRVAFDLPTCLLAVGAATLAGNLSLQLHCPVTERAHLLVGHASVAVLWLIGYSALQVFLLGRASAAEKPL